MTVEIKRYTSVWTDDDGQEFRSDTYRSEKILLEDIKDEEYRNKFLAHIEKLPPEDQKDYTRMQWFTKIEIPTDDSDKIIKTSVDYIESEILKELQIITDRSDLTINITDGEEL